MSLISIEQIIINGMLIENEYIKQVKNQIKQSYTAPIQPAPFNTIIQSEHNNEVLRLSFAFYCLLKKNILVIQKSITINNTNMYLPLFHIPTRYLRTITIKTVHDETKQATEFIPCIDTDLLEELNHG